MNEASNERDGTGRATMRAIEASLLEAFSSNLGKLMSHDELCRLVWKCEFYGTTRTVDQTVATVRRKLSPNQRIVTVHRHGYSYEEANAD
jgi:DNA-binding response OmpR family regulator